jgi:hypothetical protein
MTNFNTLMNCANNSLLPTTGGTWTNGTLSGTTILPGGVITSAGSLGVGTTNPAQALEVNGAIQLDGSRLRTGVDGGNNFWIENNQGTEPSDAAFGYSTNGAGIVNLLSLLTNGQIRVSINSAGNVGIGTTAPSYPLQVNGQAAATSFVSTSDRRSKTDIKPLDSDALAVVARLKPVTFLWKEPKGSGMRGRQIGFAAQDVEKVVPEAVLTMTDAQKTLGLEYDLLIPILTKAIQQQQAQIAELASLVRALKAAK